MQLKYDKTILSPSDYSKSLLPQKITALAWAPNCKKLAVCTVDRTVFLFDENGDRQDKFSTKPADKTVRNFIVKALAFSPDSTKLAVAQTDSVVFVYKLGVQWGEKKSIVNKIQQNSPVTCLVWPGSRPEELFFGLADGKVKIGHLKTNKASTLFNTDLYVTAIAASPDGEGIISGHVDGTLNRFILGESRHSKFGNHCTVSYALSWGKSIAVAGSDSQVYMYGRNGELERKFNYGSNASCKEFSTAAFNPTGDTVVFGNFSSFYIFGYNQDLGNWEEIAVKEVKYMYTVTSLAWKPDGSQLAVGSLCGVLDVYNACVKQARIKGIFNLTYISLSQVLITNIKTNTSMMLRSETRLEIFKLNVTKEKYVTAQTNETLLLADMSSMKTAEVPWQARIGIEKFIFDYPNTVLVFYAGELVIIEFGENEITGMVRTDFVSTHLISVRINEHSNRNRPGWGANRDQYDMLETKSIAYLLDAQTVNIKDLTSNATISIEHSSKIDWLEMNARANLLLFRDKKRHLHIFNIEKQTRTTLLNHCSYVQWVPDTDVVVAQSRSSLCVWYNIHAPDQVTNHEISGDVCQIIREKGQTEMVVNEGNREVSYILDEPLIEFGSAIEDKDYMKAMEILEPLELTPEAEAMWSQLGDMALNNGDIQIAGRCAAAIGNVARAEYIKKISDAYNSFSKSDNTIAFGVDHWSIKFKLCLLKKDLKGAEDVLLSLGKIDEAISMYEQFQMYEDALNLARSKRLDRVLIDNMSARYFRLLVDSHQELRAGLIKESEGEFEQAMQLYLKGKIPIQALRVLQKNIALIPNSNSWMETLASSFVHANMRSQAGECFEQLNDYNKALENYVEGHNFKLAVDLARKFFPEEVIVLEEKWGDWLVIQNELDMAVNHFIEARVNVKAVDTALCAKQWNKALQLVETLDKKSAGPYFLAIAKHFEVAGQLSVAENCYVKAESHMLAIDMYMNRSQWDAAHKLALQHLSKQQVQDLYVNQAAKMEISGKLRESENLLIQINDIDSAIALYKKHKCYDQLIRLVKERKPELINEIYSFVAKEFHLQGHLNKAEAYYKLADDYASVVMMYTTASLWEDALRISSSNGKNQFHKQIAYLWFVSLGFDRGSKILAKRGLLDSAIDYAIECKDFSRAFELAKSVENSQKVLELHLKYGMFLEDEGKFSEAEIEFIAAGKPLEAIEMYLHQKNWASAIRVSQEHEPTSTSDVICSQANDIIESGVNNVTEAALHRAEELFLQAGKPERVLIMYQEARKFDDAMRICENHLPHRKSELKGLMNEAQAETGAGGDKNSFLQAAMGHSRSGNWSKAIDVLLKAQSNTFPASPTNTQDLIELWCKALEIASAKLPDRYIQIAREVSVRMCALDEHEVAADTLRDASQIEEAVKVLIHANMWSKAREFSLGNGRLVEKVEKAYDAYLSQGGQSDKLITSKQTMAALDVLAQKQDWTNLWKTILNTNLSPNLIIHYVVQCITSLTNDVSQLRLSNGNPLAIVNTIQTALTVLATHDLPSIKDNLGIYQNLVKIVLGMTDSEERISEKKGEMNIFGTLKDVLFQLRTSNDRKVPAEFENLLMALHYSVLMKNCERESSKESLLLGMKISVSLLRYSHIIPADKCFYRAGQFCRKLGERSLGFILLNRYVDIIEAIEDNNVNLLDNSDFSQATNIPILTNETLPKVHYVTDENCREEIRDWVLSTCVDSKLDQQLPDKLNSPGTIFETMFDWNQPNCVVTGYPVRNQAIEIDGYRANRQDFNLYTRIFKKCPWTEKSQNPQY